MNKRNQQSPYAPVSQLFFPEEEKIYIERNRRFMTHPMAFLFLIAAITSNNTVVVICFFTGIFFLWHNTVSSLSVCMDIGGERAGTVNGLMNFAGQIGSFFLAVIFGKIVNATHSFNAPLYVMTVLLVIGSLCWLLV